MAYIASKGYQYAQFDFMMAVSDALTCSNEEEYLTTPIFIIDGTVVAPWDHFFDGSYSVTDVWNEGYGAYNKRGAFYIDLTPNTTDLLEQASNSAIVYNGRWTYNNGQSYMDYPRRGTFLGAQIGGTGSTYQCSTNIPIFETKALADQYVLTGEGLKYALNYKDSEIEPEHGDVFVNNWGVLQKWTENGKEDVHSSSLIYRTFRMKITQGKLSFYKIEGIDNDALKCGIKYSNDFSAYSIGYSEDGGNTWTYVNQLPYNFIYRTRENELGEFYACPTDFTALDTNIPMFENEDDADDYMDGNKDVTDAINWSNISSKYPITNGTEYGEEETEFGEVYMRSVFSQLYVVSSGALSKIANDLFDTSVDGVWDKIKKGIEMYGTDPMQCVQGLTFYPFDLSTIFNNLQDQHYVYFGGYQCQLENNIVKKVIFPQGYKDLGTMTIKRSFNDWRDFEPYTKLFVYLPYVGVQQLSLARYYDKTVTVRYYLDIRTAVCMVVLIANGVMLDYFMGQMGVQMPITLTDFARYSANQINTIMQGATTALSAVNPFCGSIAKVGLAAASSLYASEQADMEEHGNWASLKSQTHDGSKNAIAATVAGEVGAMGLAGGLTAMKTTFELSQNGINGYNKTKGSATSMLNCYLPQYITFMFEIMESDESEYLNELAGRPTNMSGTIGDFSGYLECDDVMLICPIATDAERQEIINLVRAGIYL